jgi:NAD+ synthase (glutamine-hydrolysing)
MRHFASAPDQNERVCVAGQDVPFGTRLLFANQSLREMVVGVEICEDLWMVSPPSGAHCRNGATIIINPSASTQAIGKPQYREQLVAAQSARCIAAYIYVNAGPGESTTDVVSPAIRSSANTA